MSAREEVRGRRVARPVTSLTTFCLPRVSGLIASLRLRTIPPLAGSPAPERSRP